MGTLDNRSKTGPGSSRITKLGHTSGNQYGQNPRAVNSKRATPKEERG